MNSFYKAILLFDILFPRKTLSAVCFGVYPSLVFISKLFFLLFLVLSQVFEILNFGILSYFVSLSKHLRSHF